MADGLTRNEAASEAPLPAPAPPGAPPIAPAPEPTAALEPADEPDTIVTSARRDWQPGPFAGRFLLAYGLLGLLVGASVIAFAVMTSERAGDGGREWSAWAPKEAGSERIREIARRVSNSYRLPNESELVAVLPRSPESMPTPVTTAVIDEQTLFEDEQRYTPHDLDDGMLYFLCGLGANCSINEGQPSMERQQLLRRQALELALYTFRYADVDPVVVVLPPRRPAGGGQGAAAAQEQQLAQQQTPLYALFFRKDDYERYLDEPLRETLPTPPPLSGGVPETEGAIVDELTLPQMYQYQLQPSSDGQSALLLLEPAVETG